MAACALACSGALATARHGYRRSAREPRRGAAGAAPRIVATAAAAADVEEEQPERRYEPWSQKVYTFEELCVAWKRQADMTREEAANHWETQCKPVDADGKVLTTAPESRDDAEAATAGDADGGLMPSMRRLWTSADSGHIHAIAGGLYAMLGLLYLVAAVIRDSVAITVTDGSAGQAGGGFQSGLPLELVLFSMLCGAANALSALQPSLLGRRSESLPELLGFGEQGSVKSGGFINASLFYFVLSYQALRILPSFPAALGVVLDPAMGAASILGLVHARFILNKWVDMGALPRSASGADLFFAPPFLNLPVALHLLLQGQSWVEQITAAYPGFAELFFWANYMLAWSLSMATFVLTLYERRLFSIDARLLWVIGLPLVVFLLIVLRVSVLIPEWLGNDWIVIFTLSPLPAVPAAALS